MRFFFCKVKLEDFHLVRLSARGFTGIGSGLSSASQTLMILTKPSASGFYLLHGAPQPLPMKEMVLEIRWWQDGCFKPLSVILKTSISQFCFRTLATYQNQIFFKNHDL
jgi:hypothetical protein